MTHVPMNGQALKNCGLPFGILIQPMADIGEGEQELPLGTVEGEGPFRCGTCGAYVNPGFAIVEGGSAMACNMCNKQTNIGSTAYAYNHDKSQFPELSQGAYEFEVGGRYIY